MEGNANDLSFVRRVTDLDPVEARVLGCLLEKQRTTPDTYPLTLNALRLACNQSTNRSPVVDFNEEQVHDALQGLYRRELSRNASGHGSRASKYRHLLSDTLALDDAQQAVLCVLLLRGPQTPGELKTRTDRLHEFGDLESLDETLSSLIERGIAERLPRRPGEKQERYRELMTSGGVADGGTDVEAPVQAAAAAPDEIEQLRARIELLEQQVAELRARM